MADSNPSPSAVPNATEGELVITRVFDAPRELVWRAWTEPEHFMRWWGPRGFTVPHCTIDLRPGGRIHFCMRWPDGRDIWSGGIVREVIEPSLLVSTACFVDAEGNLVSPTHYGLSADFPPEVVMTVTFEDYEGNKTRLTLRETIPTSVAEGAGAYQGWNESFDRLADYLTTA